MGASQNDWLLSGRLILVVQRQWLIALQLSAAFKAEGARVLLAHDVSSGALLADDPDLAAAVLGSEGVQLCRKLKGRGVPFVIYTGREHVVGDGAAAPLIRKPAKAQEVVGAVRRLL